MYLSDHLCKILKKSLEHIQSYATSNHSPKRKTQPLQNFIQWRNGKQCIKNKCLSNYIYWLLLFNAKFVCWLALNSPHLFFSLRSMNTRNFMEKSKLSPRLQVAMLPWDGWISSNIYEPCQTFMKELFCENGEPF